MWWETVNSKALSMVPLYSYVAQRNSIGLGRFVYHIWQDSGRTRMGIGREQPSFTKSSLTGFYKQRVA